MRNFESIAIADIEDVVGKMVHHIEDAETGKFYSDIVVGARTIYNKPNMREVELQRFGTINVNVFYENSEGKLIPADVAYEA